MAGIDSDKAKKKALRALLLQAQVEFSQALVDIEGGKDVDEVFGVKPGEELATNIACDSSCG